MVSPEKGRVKRCGRASEKGVVVLHRGVGWVSRECDHLEIRHVFRAWVGGSLGVGSGGNHRISHPVTPPPAVKVLQKMESAVLLWWRQTEMRNGVSATSRWAQGVEMPGTAVAGQGISTLPEPPIDWGYTVGLIQPLDDKSISVLGVRRPPKREAVKRPGSGDAVLQRQLRR